MKKNLLIFVVAIMALSLIFAVGCSEDGDNNENGKSKGKWIQKANYPGTAVTNPIAFSINGKIYVGMGGTGYDYKHDFWEYNPTTDKWTQKKSSPSAKEYNGTMYEYRNLCHFVSNNKGYVIAYNGYDGDCLWEYNALNDTWTEKMKCPVPPNTACFAVGNYAYVICYERCYKYNIETDEWTRLPDEDYRYRLTKPVLTSDNNYAYCLSSYIGNTFWIYDPKSNEWAQRADYPERSYGDIVVPTSIWVHNNYVYAGMGYSNDIRSIGTVNDIYRYDSKTNAWEFATTFPGSQRAGQFSIVCNGKIYVGLGGFLDFWEYQP